MLEMEKQLKEAVGFAKKVQKMNENNTNNGGVKMYAKRKCSTTKRYYYEDRETKAIVDIILDAMKDAFDINPSRTILIRYALRVYANHFTELMLTGTMTGDIEQFIADLKAEKEAIMSVKKK